MTSYLGIILIIIVITILCVLCFSSPSSSPSPSFQYDDTRGALAAAAATLPTAIFKPIAQIQADLAPFREKILFDCKNRPVPPVIKDLVLGDRYKRTATGTLTTIVDEETAAKDAVVKKSLTDMNDVIADLGRDMAILSNPADIKKVQDCMLNALYTWASAGALTGTVNDQGKVERTGFEIIMALGFLKINQVYPATDNKMVTIKKWLQTMENSDWLHFKDRHTNLKSWAVLAHFLVAIVIQNEAMYTESINAFVEQVNYIKNDGTVATELERAGRASLYHIYYAIPLVVMQYILKFINNPLYNQPKLHNLVNLIVNIVKDNQFLVKQKFVKEQQLEMPPNDLQFFGLYDDMFKNEFIKPDTIRDTYATLAAKYNKYDRKAAFNLGNVSALFGL